jgi:hypothetical protein
LAKSSQTATVDRPLKFENEPRKLSLVRKVPIFFKENLVLRSHWRKPH